MQVCVTLGQVARAWVLRLLGHRAARGLGEGMLVGGGALVPPPVKGEGDTPCPSPGRDTQLSGLGSALGSCEGRGLEQGVGNTLFNGLRVLSLETFVGSADPGFLCLVRITCKA